VTDPIVFVDSSAVAEGKLEELKRAVGDLARFVEENEDDPIAYHVYFSPDGRRMTVVQIHPDSASMERHMELAGPIFARFADLVELRTVDVYGTPSKKVVEQLRRKAEVLGSATLVLHERHAGFARVRSHIS
jgi:hypothetical protein